MIDRVAAQLGRKLFEVPVGFKWFVDGLLDGSLGFGGEESAGASFLRRDGSVWTTDKDGIILALLAAEITRATGRDPAQLYRELTRELGDPVYERVDAPATPEQKALSKLSRASRSELDLAGEKIEAVLPRRPATGAHRRREGGHRRAAGSRRAPRAPKHLQDLRGELPGKSIAEDPRGRPGDGDRGVDGPRAKVVNEMPNTFADAIRVMILRPVREA